MRFPGSFAVITDEVSQELSDIGRFLDEFELPGFEVRSYNGRAFKDLTDADAREIAQFSKDEGRRVYACSTPVFKCYLDDASGIAEHQDIFRRSLDLAHSMNCDLLRVFTFLREYTPLDASKTRRVADHLRELQEIASGSGLRIGIENEHSCLVATADELLALLDELPGKEVGAVWDPCNVLYVSNAPLPSLEAVYELAPRIFHVHVKDAVRQVPKLGELPAAGVPVGVGEVDWRSQFRALSECGYEGAFALETHWRLASIDEKMLHLPAGYAFSHGGEAASRTCLHTVKAIIDTLRWPSGLQL